MELTFSCPNCGAIGHVPHVETADQATCRQCKMVRPLHPEAISGSHLEACPWCLTEELYVQKDFPQGLGLFIVVAGFAISTIFWYYEMPKTTFGIFILSALIDGILYYRVPDVTICYRCLSQLRGLGSNPDGRYSPFDLAIGERYRQERIRAQQLREREAPAD